MKKITLFALLIICTMLISGCKKGIENPRNDDQTLSSAEKAQTDLQADGTDDAKLLSLRESISEKGCMLGVGFFGYTDSSNGETAVQKFAAQSALAKAYPFLADLTPVLVEGAELYAFVPANGSISVIVYPSDISEDGNYADKTETPIYKGNPGETVVLNCNLSEIHANVLIAATDGNNTLTFHPTVSLENGRMVQQQDCYDFSVYQQTDNNSDEAARQRLLSFNRVSDGLSKGMKLLYTGDTQLVNGQQCLLFALGTEHDGQFVREQLYAVSDNRIYIYSALSDSWEASDAK